MMQVTKSAEKFRTVESVQQHTFMLGTYSAMKAWHNVFQ
jgi:hypothetical protein